MGFRNADLYRKAIHGFQKARPAAITTSVTLLVVGNVRFSVNKYLAVMISPLPSLWFCFRILEYRLAIPYRPLIPYTLHLQLGGGQLQRFHETTAFRLSHLELKLERCMHSPTPSSRTRMVLSRTYRTQLNMEPPRLDKFQLLDPKSLSVSRPKRSLSISLGAFRSWQRYHGHVAPSLSSPLTRNTNSISYIGRRRRIRTISL